MHEGQIIEYIDQGKFICTLCLQDRGSRLHLLTAYNREVNLSHKRTLLVSNRSIDPSRPREELLDILKRTEETRDRLKEEINVKDLWELVKDEKESFSHSYLTELVFGEDVRDDHVSALMRALFEDHLYFKYKDGRFLPQSEERVELIIRQMEEEALKEERLSTGSVWLKTVLSGELAAPPDCSDFLVNLLEQVALWGEEAQDLKYAKELLARADIRDIRQARSILRQIGIWEEHENLDLLRSGIRTGFSAEELAAASELAQGDFDAQDREDLTGLHTLTIDGASTEDYDDALSLEKVDGFYELGIHIADVAAMIPPDTLLDRTAAERASSLYLPRRQVPMLPPGLSQDTLSLKAGCDRPALSLLARFDAEGNLAGFALKPSIIRVKDQLTYESVNAQLEEDPRLQDLLRLSRRFREVRHSQGALNISLPEVDIVFNEAGEVQLSLIDQDTPSRMIVAEIMILYNWLTARFCVEHQIPTLFRTQPEPSEKVPLEEKDYLFYVFQQRRKLAPLQIQTAPKPHCGLGVDAYIQASSPIRRYLDLVVQRQISAFLLERAFPYDAKKLEEIRLFTDPLVREIGKIKRNRLRYWILTFFSLNRGKTYRAVVLDELKSKYRVVLRNTQLIAEIRKADGKIFQAGQEILVTVGKADPWEDILELKVADNQ